MSHVSYTNESCLIYQWVKSHISMSQVSYINESYLIYQWVMSHTLTRHVPYINESYLIYQWVMSHTLTSHVPYINESCLIYQWVMSHISMSHVSYINESCPKCCERSMTSWSCAHFCDVTHSYMTHSYIYETWLIHIWHMTRLWVLRSLLWYDSSIHDSWLIHTWLINEGCVCFCDMTRTYMTGYECFARFCDMTHHSCLVYEWVMSSIRMRRVTHYGVATVSRIDWIIGLFCRISFLL